MSNKNTSSQLKTMRWPHELLKQIEVARGEKDFSGWVKAVCQKEALKAMAETVDTHKEKLCKKCGNVWPLTDYPIDKKRPNGRGYTCKHCKAAYDKTRNQ